VVQFKMIQKKNNLKKRKTAIDILEAEPNQSEKNQYFDLLNLMATLFLNIFITARIEISKFCWNRLCVAKQFIRSRMVRKKMNWY